MRRPRRRNNALVYALYANAAVLLAILALLVARGGGLGGSTALAAQPQMPPIAGGGGLYMMPAQFSMQNWGCYLMDIDAQTICAYQYYPAQNQLRLVAARHFRHDRRLKEYNTWPSPKEIEHLIEKEKAGLRGQGNDPANDVEPPPEVPPLPGGTINDPATPAGPPQGEQRKSAGPAVPGPAGAAEHDDDAVGDEFQKSVDR